MTAVGPTTEVCEIASQALLCFTGPDARTFLQGQLTCDVDTLTPEKSTYGSYCTPKGRILATFLLWRTGDDYFMQLPALLRDAVQKRLSMYVLRSKVKIADASNEWVRLGLAGKSAATYVRMAGGTAPSEVHGVTHTNDVTAIRLPGERFEVLVPAARATPIKTMLANQAEVADPQHWDWLDIRSGIPVVGPTTQEEFVPQMANLDLIGGISFTKGCYPGQEIVARMHYRGTLKQRMYLASVLEGAPPQPGDKLYSPETGTQSCGMILSAAPGPDGLFDVLAVMQIAAAEHREIHLGSPDGPELELEALPYKVTPA